jgi:hypothetical protein
MKLVMEKPTQPSNNESYLLEFLSKAAYILGYYSVYIKRTFLTLVTIILIIITVRVAGIRIEVSKGEKQLILILKYDNTMEDKELAKKN